MALEAGKKCLCIPDGRGGYTAYEISAPAVGEKCILLPDGKGGYIAVGTGAPSVGDKTIVFPNMNGPKLTIGPRKQTYYTVLSPPSGGHYHNLDVGVLNGSVNLVPAYEDWGWTYICIPRGAERSEESISHRYFYRHSGYLESYPSEVGIVEGGYDVTAAVDTSSNNYSVLHRTAETGQIVLTYKLWGGDWGSNNLTGYNTGTGPMEMVYWNDTYYAVFNQTDNKVYLYSCPYADGTDKTIEEFETTGLSPRLAYDDNYLYLSIATPNNEIWVYKYDGSDWIYTSIKQSYSGSTDHDIAIYEDGDTYRIMISYFSGDDLYISVYNLNYPNSAEWTGELEQQSPSGGHIRDPRMTTGSVWSPEYEKYIDKGVWVGYFCYYNGDIKKHCLTPVYPY